MRRHITRRTGVGVVAPRSAEPVAPFENGEIVVPSGQLNTHGDTAGTGPDDANPRPTFRRRPYLAMLHIKSYMKRLSGGVYYHSTGLVVIDPYNDFISEGGKVWDRLKGVAEANGCVPHMARSSRRRETPASKSTA